MKTFEIVPFKREHAEDILARNKKDGFKVFCDGVDEDNLIKTWLTCGNAYTLMADEIPICCGGIIDLGWHRGEAWTLVSTLFFHHRKTAYNTVKRMLEFLAKDMKLRRVQALINESLTSRECWMNHLGFEKEGLLKNFGPNGEHFYSYSRVF